MLSKLITIFTVTVLCGTLNAAAHKGHGHPAPVAIPQSHITQSTQWQGKRVAFLGDSMTDPNARYSSCLYWKYLQQLLGIEPKVYARSGHRWTDILDRAKEMHTQLADSVDVILIWAGTNDYNSSLPIGEFFTECQDTTNYNGHSVVRRHRTPVMDSSTFCGSINMVLSYLKSHYPTRQIILLTPIHRGYARFSDRNEQPDENYANARGLYIDDYIDVLHRAGSVWAIPVIDLWSLSGLHPMTRSQEQYFHHPDTDMLHPNSTGNYRLARTLQMQLLALPPDF